MSASVKTNHPAEYLKALGIDGLKDHDKYRYEGGTLTIHDAAQADIDAIVVDDAAISARAAALVKIAELERSIDTPRMRREYAEGMRKKLEGVSPTADELWTINKVQSVDSQIKTLRAGLN